MNLNELWAGQDYAFYNFRGRNDGFRSGAPRVKVIRTYKKKASWENERLSGFAEVLILEKDGTPKVDSRGEHITREVRARDLAMRWEEYEQEANDRESRRLAIMKEEEIQRAKDAEAINKLQEALLTRYNIPERLIYNITDSHVIISRRGLEEELGIVRG